MNSTSECVTTRKDLFLVTARSRDWNEAHCTIPRHNCFHKTITWALFRAPQTGVVFVVHQTALQISTGLIAGEKPATTTSSRRSQITFPSLAGITLSSLVSITKDS